MHPLLAYVGPGVGLSAIFVFLVSIFAIFTLVIGGTVLWVWAIVDCASKEPSEGNDKSFGSS